MITTSSNLTTNTRCIPNESMARSPITDISRMVYEHEMSDEQASFPS